MVPVLRKILQEKRQQINERKLLLIIATDGVPTNENGTPDAKSLENLLRDERIPIDRIPVTILACTGKHDKYFSKRISYFIYLINKFIR